MAEAPHIIPEEKEPSSARLIISLGIAGLLSGIILVGTYLYTQPIIDQNKAEALREAIFEVLPNTDSFLTLVPEGEGLRETTEGEEIGDEVVYLGLDSLGSTTGFAIPGGEPGYQDIIAALYGFVPEEEMIIGFKVLESKETPGLGDKIFKDLDFQTNFTQLKVDPPVEVVKKGEKTSPNQIEAITGATISSKAIGRLLAKSVEQWQGRIDAYLVKKDKP